MPKAVKSFIFLFLIVCIRASGQASANQGEWRGIDSAIQVGKNLQIYQLKLLELKTKAIADGNDVALARSLSDLILIEDQRSEDTLFFKNAAFMDSILRSSSSSVLLKSIMHLLLAKRINEFKQRFTYRHNKNLVRTGNPSTEYGLMTNKELDSLITEHLEKAISISKQLNRTNADELLWLSSDPLIFLFKPGYTDLLYGERIFMFHTHRESFSNKNAPTWLSDSQDWFINNGGQIKSFTSYEQMLFRYFHEWIVYNLSSRPEAAYFTETLARKYFYENLTEDSANKAAYERYLCDLLPSPFSSVSSHAVYQLCKIWSADAAKYNQTLGSPVDRYGRSGHAFDSSYRLYYNKTLDILDRFENRLDSFSYIRNDLLYNTPHFRYQKARLLS